MGSCQPGLSSLMNFESVSQFQLHSRAKGVLAASEIQCSFEFCENKRF